MLKSTMAGRFTKFKMNPARNGLKDTSQLALHTAVSNHKIDDLRKLLGRPNINPNVRDKENHTPLQLAALNGFPEAVAELCKHKDIKVDLVDDFGHSALSWAVESGEEDSVTELVAKGAKPSLYNRDRRTIFYRAVEKYPNMALAIFDTLQDRGLSLKSLEAQNKDRDTGNLNGETPLHAAAKRGLSRLVAGVEAGYQPTQRISDKATPLHIAAENDHEGFFQELWTKTEPSSRFYQNSKGEDVLHVVARRGNKDLTRLILGTAEVVDRKNTEGKIPVQLAIEGKHWDVVSLLLGCKQSITPDMDDICHNVVLELLPQVNPAEETPSFDLLSFVAPRGPVKLAEHIISKYGEKKKIIIDGCGKVQPLLLAVKHNRPDMVKFLLDNGASPNGEFRDDYNCTTPLGEAVGRGYTTIAETLFQCSEIDINQPSADPLDSSAEPFEPKKSDNSTPLGLAIKRKNIALTKMLASHPKIELSWSSKETALKVAYEQNAQEIIELLLSIPLAEKALVSSVEILHKACADGRTQIVELFLKDHLVSRSNGGPLVDLNQQDQEGRTPLFLATWHAHPEVVEKLLDKKLLNKGLIDPGLTSEYDLGKLTPLEAIFEMKLESWAQNYRMLQCLELLLKSKKVALDDEKKSFVTATLTEGKDRDGEGKDSFTILERIHKDYVS